MCAMIALTSLATAATLLHYNGVPLAAEFTLGMTVALREHVVIGV